MAETKLRGISVLHRRGLPRFAEKAEYIGRPSPLGNPFMIGTNGTRDEVIERYKCWLLVALTSDMDMYKKVGEEFDRLCRKYKDDGVLRLVCWCAPLRCHGDVIADFIEDRVHGRDLW